MLCVESLEYVHLDVVVGGYLEMRCNTSLRPGMMWSYHSDDNDGYVDYVYWNGDYLSEERWRRLHTKQITEDFHVLDIGLVEKEHGGRFDCYDETGKRKVGYHVTIAGKRSVYAVSPNKHQPFLPRCME